MWYQASASASTAFGSRSGNETLTVVQTEVDTVGLKIKVTVVPNASVKLSTSDAKSYGYMGDNIYEDADVAFSDLYDYITLGIEGVYKAMEQFLLVQKKKRLLLTTPHLHSQFKAEQEQGFIRQHQPTLLHSMIPLHITV